MSEAILADRVRGAIWGQLVGDAICLGTHLIYDQDELCRLHSSGARGFEASAAADCPRPRRRVDRKAACVRAS